MDRAKLGDEARSQVLRLASEIRSQAAAPVAAAPAADAASTRVSRGDSFVMPVMSPLMDRLGNGPIMR
jgi:hypothetical protein